MIVAIDAANIAAAMRGNSGITVVPLITTVVAPSGTVNLTVLEPSGFAAGFLSFRRSWLPAITELIPEIIAFASVSSTSPALSNTIVTASFAFIVAVVALAVGDSYVIS